MSVVACCIKDGNAVIGSDSVAIDGNGNICYDVGKLIVKSKYILGAVGSLRMLQILSYSDILDINKDTLDTKDIFEIANDIRDIAIDFGMREDDDRGFLPRNNEVSCIVLTSNNIYVIDTDYSIAKFDRVHAIGIGGHIALGCMKTLYNSNMTAKEIVEKAIRTTIENNAFCGGEVIIRELKCTKQ